jgi:hypothetical protein
MMILGTIFKLEKVFFKVTLCPLCFFNIVFDMLAVLIARAKEDGQVGRRIPHLVEGGVSILQYADDTILFMEPVTSYMT